MLLKFTKMHGLGNDFMVVDLVSQRARIFPDQVRSLADRNFGIGFDQLLIVEPPGDPEMDFRYRIYNADGSDHASYEHVGKRMIWDMKSAGDGSYSGGKIWAPDKDKTYKSKMSLSGNKLTVKGCVAGGAICRGQTWTKVN